LAPVAKATGAVPFTGRVAQSGPVPTLWQASGALGFEPRGSHRNQDDHFPASTLALSRERRLSRLQVVRNGWPEQNAGSRLIRVADFDARRGNAVAS